jgi:hypothetical protein
MKFDAASSDVNGQDKPSVSEADVHLLARSGRDDVTGAAFSAEDDTAMPPLCVEVSSAYSEWSQGFDDRVVAL